MKIRRTGAFDKWLTKLRDNTGKALILDRIRRLEDGNRGDWRLIEGNLFEMRIRFGPGYRVYYKDTGEEIITLLCGGDKSTQQADIERAKKTILGPREEENDGNS
ncbi:MAG: type II toxin-antitoxin system RelE/ParE family toxin [Treponema sp.]|nr:type II toxin-antitoxin system RelE/ParE family toxin [Treponema sp.]